MKKILIIFILVAVIATGTAFADHPDGFGIGVLFGGGSGWENGSPFGSNINLSLKIPEIPIYWGIGVEIYKNWMAVGVTGDYYLIDRVLVPEIWLHWYLGVGGWVTIAFGDHFDTYFGAGARVPIGLSWQLPLDEGEVVNTLEIFLEIAPNLGFQTVERYFPAGRWSGALGIRVWF